jgi:hypothetical protein
MRFIFIVLLFITNIAYSQHWMDSVKLKSFHVMKTGEWIHMDKPPWNGSYNKGNASASYSTICYQLEVFTEKANHHGSYIVSINGIDQDTISCYKETFEPNMRTWAKIYTTQRNRTIKIRSLNTKPIVINSIRRWVSGNPDYVPPQTDCKSDTIYITKRDTIFLTPNYYFLPDSIVLK